MTRSPKPIDHPLAEGVAYVVIAIFALLIIAGGAKQGERLSPGFQLSEAGHG